MQIIPCTDGNPMHWDVTRSYNQLSIRHYESYYEAQRHSFSTQTVTLDRLTPSGV